VISILLRCDDLGLVS